MKHISTIAFFLLTVLCATAQTNVYHTTITPEAKCKTCSCLSGFWTDGHGTYLPETTNINLAWFGPDTNIMSLTFSNSLEVIQVLSDSGPVLCAKAGTVTWTNNNFTNAHYRFTIWWSTNTPVPTNLLVPITAVGFTNSPT